jgi:hypothetical protein
MPSAPWPAIEANPDIYIDREVRPQNVRLCSPAQMEVEEIWAWIAHIQKGKTASRLCFRPQDDIVLRLEAQAGSSPTE